MTFEAEGITQRQITATFHRKLRPNATFHKWHQCRSDLHPPPRKNKGSENDGDVTTKNLTPTAHFRILNGGKAAEWRIADVAYVVSS